MAIIAATGKRVLPDIDRAAVPDLRLVVQADPGDLVVEGAVRLDELMAAEGASLEEDEIIAFAEQRLARYKCPQKVWFVDELPKGLGGKVRKHELRGLRASR